MSVDYAAGLSHCDDLGVCGLDEVFDKIEVVRDKVAILAGWLRAYNGSCCIHVGAGLSTSAGIPDFRGKRGVWTRLQERQRIQHQLDRKIKHEITETTKQEEEEEEIHSEGNSVIETGSNSDGAKITPFDEAIPTLSHRALRVLCDQGYIRHIISQNVDGLFLKINLARQYISELHGDFYLDECTKCKSRFIRSTASKTMRLERSDVKCPRGAEQCKGYLRDTILDWDSPIPHNELRVATREANKSQLHICIGTSLQLSPSRELVCKRKISDKHKKLVIINLQPTKFDEKADLVINYYANYVMKELCDNLGLDIPEYQPDQDPTKDASKIGTRWKK